MTQFFSLNKHRKPPRRVKAEEPRGLGALPLEPTVVSRDDVITGPIDTFIPASLGRRMRKS
jgi:hypothetical protein